MKENYLSSNAKFSEESIEKTPNFPQRSLNFLNVEKEHPKARVYADLRTWLHNFDGSETSFVNQEKGLDTLLRKLSQDLYVFKHDYKDEQGNYCSKMVGSNKLIQYVRTDKAIAKGVSDCGLFHNGSLESLKDGYRCVLVYAKLIDSEENRLRNWTGFGLEGSELEEKFKKLIGMGKTPEKARLDALIGLIELLYVNKV